MTAEEAKQLVNASAAMKASEEVAGKCLEKIYEIIRSLAQQGETQVIISDNDKTDAASMYHHPCRWNEKADWEHVERIVKSTLQLNGFSIYAYYNGISHLKISW